LSTKKETKPNNIVTQSRKDWWFNEREEDVIKIINLIKNAKPQQ
jgi:hypothetical protein